MEHALPLQQMKRMYGWDSSVCTTTGTDLTVGLRFSAGARFSLLHSFQTGSGALPVSYPVVTVGLFPYGVKRLGREADHSPPSSTEVKNGGAIPSLPHISS
jgi:hypothetical protein